MPQTYLVSYDIADPKRLKTVFKVMKGWGDHLQFSVFRCDLNPRELVELRGAPRPGGAVLRHICS